MSRDTWDLDYGPLRGFYRDREQGWIFGVCAGLADRFNFRVGTVRVIAIISLLLFSWLTLALYLGADDVDSREATGVFRTQVGV